MTASVELDRELLQELLWAYGPAEQEDQVRDICRRELKDVADEMWQDDAGNLIGLLRGRDAEDAPPTRVTAHLDELAMLVKRVEPDGRLKVMPLGVMYPANFGLGPVAILGNEQALTGVLSLGSEHTTQESPRIWQTKPDAGDKSLDWLHVYVFTGRTTRQLTDAGVRPGTRVCIDRSKRTLMDLGDYLGSYFMDDRAAVLALLQAARLMAQPAHRPRGDVYLIFSANEEIGGIGAVHAGRTLPGNLTLAVEVGPAEDEYGTAVGGGPIIGYADSLCVYDKSIADRLMDVATQQNLRPQAAVLGAFESDASHAKGGGLAAKAALLCLPTLNTHGYEVMARHAVPDMVTVVVEFLRER